MQHYLRDQVDWPQAFPAEEHAARLDRVRTALRAAGLDAIYVTVPADLTWLTGYDMIWYHLRNLTGMLVRAASAKTIFFDHSAHVTIVSTTPEIRDVVWLENGPTEGAIKTIADKARELGLSGKRVALQPWSYAPHASTIAKLGEALEDIGATTADGSLLVEELRLVKSAREIAHVRRAAEIADEAMCAVRDAIEPGIMETEIEAVIAESMMKAGGGYPGIRTMIGSGPRAGTHHSPPTHRRIRQGDLVFVDFCSSFHRYHVNLNRTFSVGEPDPRWRDLMEKAAGCIDAIVDGVRPGDMWSRVQELGDRHTDHNGLRPYVWFIGGYSLGIAVPPDWVGVHRPQPSAEHPDRVLEPGMVFNFENQFDVWEDWPGGSGAAYIETLLMTETGLTVLSSLRRDLVVV